MGDCRAVASEDAGSVVLQITNDHKPSDPIEQQRIVRGGGTVYQNKGLEGEENPFRVLPGRLSVSRTIGDLEAKDPKYGGNRNVVVAEPEIHEYGINEQSDFLVLGCTLGVIQVTASSTDSQTTRSAKALTAAGSILPPPRTPTPLPAGALKPSSSRPSKSRPTTIYRLCSSRSRAFRDP